jgi:hypothetical protein
MKIFHLDFQVKTKKFYNFAMTMLYTFIKNPHISVDTHIGKWVVALESGITMKMCSMWSTIYPTKLYRLPRNRHVTDL